MRLLLLIFIWIFSFSVQAQNRNSIWCFGDSAGIDFRNTSSPLPFESGMDGRGSCVSISDSLGNLEFYSNTYVSLALAYVWNQNHDILLNGGDSILSDGLYNELQIVPIPGNLNQYYIFYTGIHTYFDGIYYSIVDMTRDNGRGEVIIKNQFVYGNRVGDCLQAVQHANGRDWWLISKQSSTNQTQLNRFLVYLITPDGISALVSYDFNDASDNDFQKIIFNSNYTKIMNINLFGYMCEYDFDRCNGIISNPRLIYSELTSPPFHRLLWEGSYSSSGNIFYCSTAKFGDLDSSFLIQYNLLADTISNSADTLDVATAPIGIGAVRLAPDSKIYYSRAYESPSIYSFPYADSMYNSVNMNLSVINEPKQLGAACNFLPFSFYLGGKRTYYGLPSNPNYQLGPIIGSVCDSLFNSIDDRFAEEIQVEVYPNPFIKSLTVQSLSSTYLELKLYNNLGSLLLTRKFRDSIQLDLTFLRSGTYHLELISEKSVVMKRIVKTE